MKHPAKMLLSLLLSAVLLLAALVPSFAAAAPVTPVIVVSGMNSFPLYSGETGERVWGPQTKTILSMVGRILWPTVKALMKGDMEQLADDTFDDVYQSLFAVLSCDETGEPLHPVDAVIFPQSVDHYPDELLNADETEDEIAVVKTVASAVGAEHVYFFNYDWRLDPRDDAAALHAFMETVKQEQHAAKVTLVPCSMGGAVVNSLLSMYGSADIAKIVCCLVASKGIDMVGELFGRNIELDMHVLLERLFNFENGNIALQALLSVLQGGFELNPLLTKALTKLLQSILDKTNERAYRDILLRSFATMPGLWAFVPDRYYEADKKIMFPDGGNKAFIEKIDAYHADQVQSEDLMRRAMETGTQIAITASYGFVGMPLTKQAYTQGDCLIETHNESFGATAARYGETLSADYTALSCGNPAHDHLSDDLIVNAATCAFPEQTWFIKHMKHVGFPVDTGAAKLLAWLVTTDAPTTGTDSRFQQFCDLDPVTGKMQSLSTGEKKAQLFDKESTIFTRFLKFFVDLWHKLVSIFDR